MGLQAGLHRGCSSTPPRGAAGRTVLSAYIHRSRHSLLFHSRGLSPEALSSILLGSAPRCFPERVPPPRQAALGDHASSSSSSSSTASAAADWLAWYCAR